MSKKTYTVTRTLLCDKKRYEDGDAIELDDKTAGPLLARGAIVEGKGHKAAEPEKSIPVGGDRMTAIKEAIGKLEAGNPDHFTEAGKGKPKVEVIEFRSGLMEVSAAERDAAWEDLQVA